MKVKHRQTCNIARKGWLIAFCQLVLAVAAFAQATSPYSRYGLGYNHSNVFSSNFAMGGVAAAYASTSNINIANPASYASLTRTTLDAGMNVHGINIQTKDSLYRSNYSTLSHITVGFVPKADKWAITIGLTPFTSTNYVFIQDFDNDTVAGAHRNIYSGKGSLYQVFIGGAYKIKSSISEQNEFSIGFNAGYVFGNLNYQKVISFVDTLYAFNTRNLTELNVNGFNYNAGFQYRRVIRAKKSDDETSAIYMTVGAYGTGGVKLRAKTNNYWDRFGINVNTGVIESVDTQQAQFNVKNKVSMPFTLGGGLMFGNEKFWLLSADFKYSNWKSFSSPVYNGDLADSWRVSAGMQIVPKYDGKFLAKIQYRLGGYAGKSEIMYNGKQLNEAGGTVGLGIPFKLVHFMTAALNIGADIGSRGGSDKSVIRENYYRINFGFVLNDALWFRPKKFD